MFKNAKKILIIALALALVAIAGGFGSVAAGDKHQLDETGTLNFTKTVSEQENILWEFGGTPSAGDVGYLDDTVTFKLTPGDIIFEVDGQGLPESSQTLDIKFVEYTVTVPTGSGTTEVTPKSIDYNSEAISTSLPTKIDDYYYDMESLDPAVKTLSDFTFILNKTDVTVAGDYKFSIGLTVTKQST